MRWPDRRLIDLFHIELPIVQAPMANSSTIEWLSRLPKPAASDRSLAPG